MLLFFFPIILCAILVLIQEFEEKREKAYCWYPDWKWGDPLPGYNIEPHQE